MDAAQVGRDGLRDDKLFLDRPNWGRGWRCEILQWPETKKAP